MGVIRKHAPHRRWSEAEVAALRALYPMAPHAELLAAIPGRSLRVIQCKANWLGLVRNRPPARTPDEVREAKRKAMAERWRSQPEKMRAYARANHAKNAAKKNAAIREMSATRIFWARALRFKGVTAHDLASLWKRQRGLCALTGRKMDRTAQVDHILPRARGGLDDISNLQWVCAEANLAKRNLTDAEFLALCSDVMRWIGERIPLRRQIRPWSGRSDMPAPRSVRSIPCDKDGSRTVAQRLSAIRAGSNWPVP